MKKQIVFGMVAATAATSVFATVNQVQAATFPATLNINGGVQFDFSDLITVPNPMNPSFPPVGPMGNSLTNVLFANATATLPGTPSASYPLGEISNVTAMVGAYAELGIGPIPGPGNFFSSIAPGVAQPNAIKSITSLGAMTPPISNFIKLTGTGGETFDFNIGTDKDGNAITNYFNLKQTSPTAYDLDAIGHIVRNDGVILNATASFDITLQGLADNGSLGSDVMALDGITGVGSFSGTIEAIDPGTPKTPEPSYILGLGGVAVLGILSRKQKRQ